VDNVLTKKKLVVVHIVSFRFVELIAFLLLCIVLVFSTLHFKHFSPGSDVTANTQSGNAYPGQCRQCDPFPFNQVVNCTGGATSTTTASAGTASSSTSSTISTTAINNGAIVIEFCFRYVRSAVCDQVDAAK